MGLWNSIFGGRHPSKDELIRSLVKLRVRQDPTAAAMGFNDRMVDSLGMLQLMSLPESTIATIVESYATLKKHSAPDHEIFAHIETHRSSIGSGEIPSPLNLASYTQYRIDLEHSHGAPISAAYLTEAVHVCRQYFGC